MYSLQPASTLGFFACSPFHSSDWMRAIFSSEKVRLVSRWLFPDSLCANGTSTHHGSQLAPHTTDGDGWLLCNSFGLVPLSG
ncbi:hypothetical protein F2P79_006858 [Pimephales promelas]|nr:hypothetical protein F2P79_006858 [Pimephales promelas]